jgi:FtsH-binding integral membrane protein
MAAYFQKQDNQPYGGVSRRVQEKSLGVCSFFIIIIILAQLTRSAWVTPSLLFFCLKVRGLEIFSDSYKSTAAMAVWMVTVHSVANSISAQFFCSLSDKWDRGIY